MVAAKRPAPSGNGYQIDQRRKVERNGTVYEQATSGINADRRRPAPAPGPDYPLHEDPRQIDIADAAQAA
jgi:hypothetical protein